MADQFSADFNTSIQPINDDICLPNTTFMNIPLSDINEIKTLLTSWDLAFLLQTCIGNN